MIKIAFRIAAQSRGEFAGAEVNMVNICKHRIDGDTSLHWLLVWGCPN